MEQSKKSALITNFICLFFIITQGVFAQVTDTGDKVGIGTTNPEAKLHVNGNSIFNKGSERLYFNSKHQGTRDFRSFIAPRLADDSGWDWGREFGFHNYYRAWYFDNKVGIATINPEAKLHVNGNSIFNKGSERLYFDSKHEGSDNFRSFMAPRKVDDSGWDWGQEFGYHNFYRAWYFDGKVGIGTTNPEAKFEVNGSVILNTGTEKLRIGSTHVGTTDFKSYLVPRKEDNSAWDWSRKFGFHNYYRAWYFDGKVGIGTENPEAKLEINGSVIINSGTERLRFGSNHTGTTDFKSYFVPRKANDSSWDWGQEFGFHNYHRAWYFDGNVGIGTSNPDEKLSVNGKIHTKEVRVDLIGWSDFVFEKEYKLPTLNEVEKHIKEKGHLEHIPSANEVAQNGILLGDMNSKLLQKIEELTLYTIAQQKEIEILKSENLEINSLKQRLTNLENLLKTKP